MGADTPADGTWENLLRLQQGGPKLRLERPPAPTLPAPASAPLLPLRRPELGTMWCPSPGIFTATGRRRGEGEAASGQSSHSPNLFCQGDNHSVQRPGHLHDRLGPQYHPVGRYLPFTDEKTEFQGASFAQGPRPGKAVGWGGGFSPAVLTASLRFLRGRWGHGHKTGAGVRASSSFTPSSPRLQVRVC